MACGLANLAVIDAPITGTCAVARVNSSLFRPERSGPNATLRRCGVVSVQIRLFQAPHIGFVLAGLLRINLTALRKGSMPNVRKQSRPCVTQVMRSQMEDDGLQVVYRARSKPTYSHRSYECLPGDHKNKVSRDVMTASLNSDRYAFCRSRA